jgi:hypothetical protein
MYVPGLIWLETAALLMREARAPGGLLPSLVMLAITVAAVALALPRAWTAVMALQRTHPPLVQ